MKGDERSDFGLRFQPQDPDEENRTLPSANLVKVLEGLQRTIHLVAMMKESHIIRERVQISHDIQERFQLYCQPAVEGSYLLPVFVAGPNRDDCDQAEAPQIAGLTHRVMEFINTGNEGELRRIIPDPAFLSRIIDSLLKVFADKTGKYTLSILDSTGRTIAQSESMRREISRLNETGIFPKTREAPYPYAITGYLGKMNFLKKEFTLKTLGCGKLIHGQYPEEFQSKLAKIGNQIIRVEGGIDVDKNGIPSKIAYMNNFFHENTAEYVELNEVLPDGLRLANADCQMLKIYPSENGRLYHARHDEIEISLEAATHADLLELVQDFLEVQWRDIGMGEDSRLSVGAQRLKKKLHNHFMEA